MKTSDFDYHLPDELVAQTPLRDRSASKLLVLDRQTGQLEDKHFTDVIDYLNPGDCLVINETKVLPARIKGEKPETGGKVELLLLKNLRGDTWECLARPQKRLHKGVKINFYATPDATSDKAAPQAPEGASRDTPPKDPPLLVATVLDTLDEGITHVEFSYDGIFNEILDQIGTMPLPPYIHEQLKDQGRYQTVYAKTPGSAAAPTAGLHFTPELLAGIEKKGVKIAKINLDVGLGTFRPVQTEDIKDHKMHSEAYEISEEAAKIINDTKSAGGRIIAVGTTSVRTLESVASRNLASQESKASPSKNAPLITPGRGETSIFIYPGYQFKVIDGLITNFHLPKSTLVMLVSAFADQNMMGSSPEGKENATGKPSATKAPTSGRDLILRAYQHAVEQKYRFFSFGDAMLIL